jgi:hypothetical protein
MRRRRRRARGTRRCGVITVQVEVAEWAAPRRRRAGIARDRADPFVQALGPRLTRFSRESDPEQLPLTTTP